MGKTFVGKILQDIASIVKLFGGIFKHVVLGAEETFNNLPDDVKQSLIHGSGILDIVNSMLDKTPDEIREAILEAYPDVNLPDLERGLITVAHTFNIAVTIDSLEDAIGVIKDYLKTKEQQSTVWEGIMHTASLLLATILSPQGNLFGALSQLIEYVYRTYIKKK